MTKQVRVISTHKLDIHYVVEEYSVAPLTTTPAWNFVKAFHSVIDAQTYAANLSMTYVGTEYRVIEVTEEDS